MGFKDIIVGLVIIGLFAFSIINFAFQLQVNNDVNQTILDDPSLAGLNTTLRNNLGNIESTAQTQREVFEQQEAQGGTADEGFSLTSIVGIVKTFFSTAIGSYNIILTLISNVFGIPPIVLNLLLGIIIIIGLIFIWRLIKVGGI